jgi:hypothetical protein
LASTTIECTIGRRLKSDISKFATDTNFTKYRLLVLIIQSTLTVAYLMVITLRTSTRRVPQYKKEIILITDFYN